MSNDNKHNFPNFRNEASVVGPSAGFHIFQ